MVLSIKDIKDTKKKMLDDLNNLTRLYQIYLSKYVDEQDITEYLQVIRELKVDKVLSFNYTKTFEKWYGESQNIDDYDYIHGKAELMHNAINCNMIIGIGEYLEYPEKNIDNEFAEFKKFFQRIYKQTGCEYTKWLAEYDFQKKKMESNPPELNIFFYGHSMDITDGEILKDLMTHENAKSRIFCKDKEDLSKKILKLVKVLGEEDLIKRTGANETSIVFEVIEEKQSTVSKDS